MENGTEWRGTAGSEMTQQKQRNVLGEAFAGEGKDGDADTRKAKQCQPVGGGLVSVLECCAEWVAAVRRCRPRGRSWPTGRV